MVPLVSVVIPSYNCAAYLPQALSSLLMQTLEQWEAIVVDDGSTDETRAAMAAFVDERIRYVYQANAGPSAARNHGLELARGKYVTMLDADDWLTPGSLADRAAFLESSPACAAMYSDGYVCDTAGRILRSLSSQRSANHLGDVYAQLIEENFFGTLSPVMVRADTINELDLRFDESNVFVEDWDFLIRLAQHVDFRYLTTACVWYRQHGANRTPSICDRRSLDSHARTFTKVVNSSRFGQVPPATQQHVYGRLVPVYLAGHPDQQLAILRSSAFRALPRQYQASIMRLVAGDYLARGKADQWPAETLLRAWRLCPGDWKCGLMGISATVSPRVTGRLLRSWRSRRFGYRGASTAAQAGSVC
jgi:glycosyltransferase involved in cell wall biosynthesis